MERAVLNIHLHTERTGQTTFFDGIRLQSQRFAQSLPIILLELLGERRGECLFLFFELFLYRTLLSSATIGKFAITIETNRAKSSRFCKEHLQCSLSIGTFTQLKDSGSLKAHAHCRIGNIVCCGEFAAFWGCSLSANSRSQCSTKPIQGHYTKNRHARSEACHTINIPIAMVFFATKSSSCFYLGCVCFRCIKCEVHLHVSSKAITIAHIISMPIEFTFQSDDLGNVCIEFYRSDF